MVTSNALEINVDSKIGRAEYSSAKTAESIRTASEAKTLNSKSRQTESEDILPGQIEENVSIPSTRNGSPINDRKAMQSSHSKSNNSSMKAENTEQKILYEKCVNIFHYLGLFIGVRISYNWKPHRHFAFYWTCSILCFAIFSVFYTIYVHWANGNYMRALEPLAISGLLVSASTKLIAYLIDWKNILALIFTMRKYFRPNVFDRQTEIVKSSLRKTWSLISIFLIGCLTAILFFAITPIIVYLTRKEIMPLIPLEIIFCDQSQLHGFIIATIVHLILGTYACSSTIIYGTVVLFCICNYTFQVDLIAVDFQDLDRMWDGKNNIPVEYKHAFLKNICKKNQDMINFLIILKHVFETKLCVYFYSSYFSQIVCLYNITQNDWIGGYGAAFGLFMEMMFYCYMGTQISIVDDKFCYIIYNSNWYMYDSKSQRIIQMLLHESQQCKELKLGPLGRLNLMTGIMIIKNIYRYYTVMKELL